MKFSAVLFPFSISGNDFRFAKRDFGAGISTLMSISNGFGISIFRRKAERTRPLREEEVGKLNISRQSQHPSLCCCCFFVEVFSLIVP